MTAPLFPPPPPTTTLAVAATGADIRIAWLLISGIVVLVAVIRVLRRPAPEWPHGMWSKIGWTVVVLYLAVPLAGYPIPIGAAAALYATRRPPTQRPAQLPYANGDTRDGK